MPSANDPLNQQSTARRRIIIITVALFVVLGFGLWLLGQRKSNTTNTSGGQYYDSRSGETISNPPGKAPEAYGTVPNQPIYPGFDKLLDIGISQYQLKALKTALYQYSQKTKQNISEFSLDVSNLTIKPNGSKRTLLFNVQFDRGTIRNMKMDYFNLTVVQLYVLNDQGRVVYNSGVVDGNPSPGE